MLNYVYLRLLLDYSGFQKHRFWFQQTRDSELGKLLLATLKTMKIHLPIFVFPFYQSQDWRQLASTGDAAYNPIWIIEGKLTKRHTNRSVLQ